MHGLIGRKVGMTRVFDDKGQQIPVTVIDVGPCVVLQRKTKQMDGYDAVQVGFGEQKEWRVTQPALGIFKKAGTTPKKTVHEFDLDSGEELKAGDVVTSDMFENVSHVDVTGFTKGRGFQGVVRRFRMSGGPLTHGGHSKRRPGSVGCRTTPARIHKGKRMPGHMGDVKVTQQNLQVVALRKEDNLLLVRGAIPGATNGVVIVRRALKKAAKAS